MATKKNTRKRESTLSHREKELLAELPTAKASVDTGRVTAINRELKELRFRRMGPKRVRKALKAIAQVARLSNRSTYTYTDDDAAKIIAALAEAVAGLESSFQQSETAKTDFEL